MQHLPKLLILGRDGILNIYREDHVKSPQEWQPVPGALEAVARLNHAGWHAVVATNQSGIGRGMIDMASINAIHAHMIRRLVAVGGRIDAVFYCPHAPDDHCDCRKPQPGLMIDIGRRYGIDLRHVPMACDTLRDLQAARASGCAPHLVRCGRVAALSDDELRQLALQVPGTVVHEDLGAFADHLMRREPAAPEGSGPSR